jgi:hypothetical protein
LDHPTPTALWEPCSIFSNLKYAIWPPFAYEDVKECHLFLMHKCETFGQRIWDEVRCYWELVWGGGGGTIGNSLRTLIRTHWELDENTFGTRKNPNNPTPTPPQEENKIRPLRCMLDHLIRRQEFLCLPVLFTIFGLG